VQESWRPAEKLLQVVVRPAVLRVEEILVGERRKMGEGRP
jgi:hypothetical protein